MIARKLRLQRGWSQDQLAELTGLNVRTIQRVERGQKPSLETAKALASVFEVDLATFITGETAMHDKILIEPDEQAAIDYAKRVKEFLEGLAVYVVLLVVFAIVFGWSKPFIYLVFLGVGIGLAIQGLLTFEVIRLPFVDWERRIAEKKLGRKL